ncbi:pentapeptide repeat-containing protein [Micromonospora arborensis]|uniref:pentapeptide repeat-containing protein n=1 Tax=Micromonospora arborensis TaxID=2116518 RepID=UPI0034129590
MTLDKTATFVDRDLRGARFNRSTLAGAVMRGVDVSGAILRLPQPFHPLGQPDAEYAAAGYDTSIFATDQPTFTAVRELRAERQAMMRDFLATVTPDLLAESRPAAWSPEHQQSVLRCLHVIFDEEWAHLRFALRDIDAQR